MKGSVKGVLPLMMLLGGLRSRSMLVEFMFALFVIYVIRPVAVLLRSFAIQGR